MDLYKLCDEKIEDCKQKIVKMKNGDEKKKINKTLRTQIIVAAAIVILLGAFIFKVQYDANARDQFVQENFIIPLTADLQKIGIDVEQIEYEIMDENKSGENGERIFNVVVDCIDVNSRIPSNTELDMFKAVVCKTFVKYLDLDLRQNQGNNTNLYTINDHEPDSIVEPKDFKSFKIDHLEDYIYIDYTAEKDYAESQRKANENNTSSNNSKSNTSGSTKRTCPNCGGTGIVKYYYGGSALEAALDGYDDYQVGDCSMCKGKGYVRD